MEVYGYQMLSAMKKLKAAGKYFLGGIIPM